MGGLIMKIENALSIKEYKWLTPIELYQAVEWLMDNRSARFCTWLANNFSGQMDRWSWGNIARAIAEYDLDIQLEMIELMY
jgi:hypothetical protein